MEDTIYQTWWALHLRAVRGERLNAEEQVTYEAGLRQLHQEEILNGDVATLCQAQATIAALEAESAQLRAKHDELAAEIAALEAAFNEGGETTWKTHF